MWEQIRANRRNSVILIFTVAMLLPLMGLAIGHLVDPAGAMPGCGVGIVLVLVLVPVATMGGSSVLLMSADAHEMQKADSPVLFNVVEEMTIAAGLPKRPKVYIMDCDAPNAFAVGSPDDCAVAVTSGLLMRLNRDELQGVIAHEIGHIKNEDTRFMTSAAVLVGAAVIIGDLFNRGFLRNSGRRRSSSGRGEGQLQIILLVVALAFILLAPILARMLYFACSRRREYLADACSAWFTRYPPGLASALEKISHSADKMDNVNGALAPLFIVNPLAAQEERGGGLFSTHPPTSERIRILRSMGGGAGMADYENASTRVLGQPVLGAGNLAGAQSAAARAPDSSDADKPPMERARQAVDILHRIAGALFIPCACGVTIKVPPGLLAAQVGCPRCGRMHDVPTAAPAGVAAAPTPSAPTIIQYTPGCWQAFRCACGNTIQLSPDYQAMRVDCPRCKATIQTIRVEPSAPNTP